MWRIAPQMRTISQRGAFSTQLAAAARPSRLVYAAAKSKTQPRRPTLDDVQRISEGKGAKNRGTGSRQIPHRLNAEERKLYDIAKERQFLTIQGNAYRRERKGAPLANIFRQLNDAHGRPCILIEQEGPLDTILVDFSPLRLVQSSEAEAAACELASELGVAPLPHGSHPSPFTVIVPEGIYEEGNEEDLEEHVFEAPVWQLPPRIVAFKAERPTAKTLAKRLAELFDPRSKKAVDAAAEAVKEPLT